MRGDFLKAKALFMAIVIITAIFTVHNFKLVTAEDETNYCCEATTDGEYCQYTTYDECNSNYLTSAVSCEQTSYCKGGCCISNQGKCSKNVPKSVCENTEGYSWHEGVDCEIEQCAKQCCTVADSVCSYTTSAHCEIINNDYPEIEAEFVDVEDEYACVDICTASNKGCCVSPDSCVYDTKSMCESPNINLGEGTGFYEEIYCSDLNLCGCIKHFETKCVDEDVYWFDGCGNQEGIVQKGDIDSKGDIYTVDNKEVSGDCDYTKGTWCGTNNKEEHYCKSVNCIEPRENTEYGQFTFNGIYSVEGANIFNDHDPNLGNTRTHGESWCLYESPSGDYLDRPGSQHYRSYCYFGEETIEPCRDYREEVCIQAPYYGDPNEPTGSACVDNNIYDAPLNTNITTVPKGNKFWGETAETSSCTEGTETCEATFVKKSRGSPQWRCVENCECLSDYWMINASKTCSSKGDCGANYNIVEKYMGDSFYITKSELAKAQKGGSGGWSALAYDIDCEEKYNDPEYENSVGMLCVETCDGLDGEDAAVKAQEYNGTGTQTCIFWDVLSDSKWYLDEIGGADPMGRINTEYLHTTANNPTQGLKNAYGVHGGMVGISEAIEEMLAGDAGAEILAQVNSKMWTAGLLVGIPVAIALIVTYAIGAAIAVGAGITTGILGTFTIGLSAGALGTGISGGLIGSAIGGAQAGVSMAAGTGGVGTTLAGAGVSSAVPIIGWIIALILVAVTALIFILTSGGESVTVTVTANCETWQPPTGGEDCYLCDLPVSEGGLALDDGSGNLLPGYDCSEYKCKSLGATCEYISENSGTDREKCYNDAINDVSMPDISLDEDIFINNEVEYEESSQGDVEGWVEVKNIDPYTQFHFGILTDELAQCKIAETPTETFDEMSELFPDSYYDKAHNQTRILTPNSNFTYYIKCQDHGGNPNIDPYVFKIFTNDVEDEQAPLIMATEPPTNTYVPAAVLEGDAPFGVIAYTSEPVQECKWSFADQEYDLMENIFLVGTGVPDTPTTALEFYRATILNVSNLGDNKFYLACKDGAGNINSQNYEYNLIGTESLNIDRTSPNGTLFYDTITLQVETSSGAEAGKATCSYDGITFFNTNASYHEQIFEGLGEGTYTHNILCQDKAGNQNSTTITYTIDIDEYAPELTSIYTKDNTLYFTLNEPVVCEYHYEDFTYGEGTATTGTIALTAIETYYIICKDEFDNNIDFEVEV
jgi:hypothetical protein